MRICVFGAGAVGGHLAAKLAAAGHEVSAFMRGAQLAAVRERGLVLLHGNEKICGKLKASDHTAELGPQEAVIVTMKANVLPTAASALAPLLGADTPVVFAQNGIPWWYATGLPADKPKAPDLSALDPGGILKKTIAPGRILGGVIYSANDVVEPGVVLNHTPGNNMLVIGECDDRDSARVKALRAALDEAGMSSPATPEIRCAVWNKAVVNLGTSSICLLADAALDAVRKDAGLKGLLARAAEEGRAIAKAHGIDPERAPQRPSGGHASGNIGHKPSMVHDYDTGRPMEIESQLMTPLAFARAAGVRTPTLEALAHLCAFKAAAKDLYSPQRLPVQ
jgi:2-dehydropantoate 2-reductase